ncbi:MAG: hypothetical protein ACRCTI_12295, partial [Beijerinckiaceae bacterium]
MRCALASAVAILVLPFAVTAASAGPAIHHIPARHKPPAIAVAPKLLHGAGVHGGHGHHPRHVHRRHRPHLPQGPIWAYAWPPVAPVETI